MNLIVAITGGTGAYAAKLLVEKSPWPVTLVASDWGKDVYRREAGDFAALEARAAAVRDNRDLSADIASGGTATAGMVILPCSASTQARIAAGLGDCLIDRAAHCHLKQRRRLVLCVREAPWTLIDLENARRVAAAGGIIMPISPPFYDFAGRDFRQISGDDLLSAFVGRVLALLAGDEAQPPGGRP